MTSFLIIATSIILAAASVYAADDEAIIDIKKEQKEDILVYRLVRDDKEIKEDDKKIIKVQLKKLLNNFETEEKKQEFFSVFESYKKKPYKGNKTFSGFVFYLLGSSEKEVFPWTADLIKLFSASYLQRYLLEMARKALENGKLNYFKMMVKEYPEICDKDILTILYKESTFFREPKNKSGYNKCKVWLKHYLKKEFAIEFSDEKFDEQEKYAAQIMSLDLPQKFTGQHKRKDVENLLSFFQSVAESNSF